MSWHNVAYLKPFGMRLLMQDVPPAQVLRRHRLPGTLLLEDGEVWVRRDTSLRFTEELSRLTNDPWAGLHAAELLSLEDCSAWGRLIVRSSTLGGALQVARANIGQFLTGTTMIVEQDGDRVRVGMRLDGLLKADPAQHHQAMLLLLRKLVGLAREPVATVSHLTAAMPGPVEELERLLGPALTFDSAWNHLTFPRDALALPLAVPRRTELEPRTRAERVHAMAKAVLQGICTRIELQRPTIVAIAGDLGVSVRTLQRHLQAWGIAFEEMVDEFRRHHAITALSAGKLPITEIGFRLGYSDSAHFSRAVRRWTGCCPRDLRIGSVVPAAAGADWLSHSGAPPAAWIGGVTEPLARPCQRRERPVARVMYLPVGAT